MDINLYRLVTVVVWLAATGWYSGTAPHGRSFVLSILATLTYGAVVWR